ncbi:MAG: hypothetical protein PH343_08510 [Nitrospira sp.]|nr:hypothetical protein [Nitrospira sp.]
MRTASTLTFILCTFLSIFTNKSYGEGINGQFKLPVIGIHCYNLISKIETFSEIYKGPENSYWIERQVGSDIYLLIDSNQGVYDKNKKYLVDWKVINIDDSYINIEKTYNLSKPEFITKYTIDRITGTITGQYRYNTLGYNIISNTSGECIKFDVNQRLF